MNHNVYAAICGLTAVCGTAFLVAVFVPNNLEAELKKQCATRDWPAHQAQAHVDYCMSLDLPVGE